MKELLKWVTYFLVVFTALQLYVGMKERTARDEVHKMYEDAIEMYQKQQEAAEKDLSASISNFAKEKVVYEEAIADLRNELISRVSKRPNRPTSTPTNPNPTIACTGAELPREDAEFLVREAARADEIVVQRDFYYKSYEDVRHKLAELKGNYEN
jgi:hypothetical protein